MTTEENNTGGDGKAAGATFTQADVDRIVRERLAREREKHADYDELKAKAAEVDKSKTALEKLAEEVKALNERTVKAERAALRADVATAKKLPAWMAKRLTGDTREELEADADEMLAALKAEGGSGKAAEGSDGKADGKATEGGDGKVDGKAAEGSDGKTEGKGRTLPPSGRPTEKLTAGAAPAAGSDKSPAELADSILKSGF